MKEGQGGGRMPERAAGGGFKVPPNSVAATIEVARYPTLEQAEWRAKELSAEAERSPRGYVQYLAKPVEARKKRG